MALTGVANVYSSSPSVALSLFLSLSLLPQRRHAQLYPSSARKTVRGGAARAADAAAMVRSATVLNLTFANLSSPFPPSLFPPPIFSYLRIHTYTYIHTATHTHTNPLVTMIRIVAALLCVAVAAAAPVSNAPSFCHGLSKFSSIARTHT